MRDINSSLFGHKIEILTSLLAVHHLVLIQQSLHLALLGLSSFQLSSKNHVNKGHQKVTTSGFRGFFSIRQNNPKFHPFPQKINTEGDREIVVFSPWQHLSDVLQDQRLVAGHAEATLRIQKPVAEEEKERHNNPREETRKITLIKTAESQQTKPIHPKINLDDTTQQWSITPDATPNWMWSFCHSKDCLTLQQLSNLANANSGALLT